MSSSPEPIVVMSSKAPAASSSETASARAFMFSVLSTARCIASPTSAICSPTPVAASEICTCASAAEYCALMTSFLVRNASIFARSFCSESVSFCCWSSSSRHLRVERLELGLRDVLAFERRPREFFLARGHRLARLRVELHELLLERGLLHLKALLRRHDVGDALLHVLKLFDLLLIAVVQRLRGVFCPFEELGHLGLHVVEIRPVNPAIEGDPPVSLVAEEQA